MLYLIRRDSFWYTSRSVCLCVKQWETIRSTNTYPWVYNVPHGHMIRVCVLVWQGAKRGKWITPYRTPVKHLAGPQSFPYMCFCSNMRVCMCVRAHVQVVSVWVCGPHLAPCQGDSGHTCHLQCCQHCPCVVASPSLVAWERAGIALSDALFTQDPVTFLCRHLSAVILIQLSCRQTNKQTNKQTNQQTKT